MLTLVGALVSNSRSQAVIEVKLDNLASKVEKHNSMVERTYALEQRMAVPEGEIESLAARGGDGLHRRLSEWQFLAVAAGAHDRAGRARRAGRKPGLILGRCVVDPDIKALDVALVMAVLSPVMAVLGGDAYGTRD